MMSDNKKKIVSALFIAAFFAFCAGILCITLFTPPEETSFFENRSLVQLSDIGTYDDAEAAFCDQAAFRTTLLKIKAWCDINLFRRPVVNGVIVTDKEVLLPYTPPETVDTEAILSDAEKMGEALSRLNTQVTEYGGTFLYAAVPNTAAYYAEKYPSYLNSREEYMTAAVKAFSDACEKNGIPYLDIGKIWNELPGRALSATDHHYTWDGCYSAYRAIMEKFSKLGGEALRILSENELDLYDAPNPFMGSYAKKLCGQRIGDERFRYALPKERIPFTRFDWGNEIPGAETVITLPDTGWEHIQYTAFMGGDISETKIFTEREELPTVLIFGDSYTNGIETLLYTGFDEMHALDLRYYGEMPLSDYIRIWKPDYVVCVRAYGQLLDFSGNGNLS